MSGGVDSSMAAALLVEQGYDVIGIMMRLWAEDYAGEGAGNLCCSPEAVDDARRVSQRLGIPFYLTNFEREFEARVVQQFCAEYARGRTPNPCIACNRYIKFDLLLRRAQSLGAHYLATGHYARIRQVDGRYQLLRGADPQKDQSYMLYMLGQEQLGRVLFPVGEYTKAQVREMAARRGLITASKSDSQEVCFIPDNDYRRFLRHRDPDVARPGPIVDIDGKVLGQHGGLAFYTIGQRQGLGIPYHYPLYVVDLDPVRNAVVVGPAKGLERRELVAEDTSFVSGHAPADPMEVTVQVRYRVEDAPATLIVLPNNQARVIFKQPQRGIAPGQAVVFYEGEVVLGGGTICQTR
ncbi:MAG: tRNA 2-thiouridine(34) synthase MnmA [Chloroflexi bacterium]|nr:tRNA 2-thiouridine(34) synthase MnmA [Chloroflexota bacterium]